MRLTWILLPGMDGTGLLFDEFVAALPKGSRYVTVAYPNATPSTSTKLLAIVKRALPSTGPYVILAESFSGPLALRAASEHTHSPQAIILCASFAKSPLPPWLLPVLAPLGASALRIHVSKFLTRLLLIGRNHDHIHPLFAAAVSTVTFATIMSRFAVLREFSPVFVPASLNVPILALRPIHDHLVPRSAAAFIKARYPHAELQNVESPHMILQCHPKEAAARILAFLQSQDST